MAKSPVPLLLIFALAVVVAATLIGLIALWPHDADVELPANSVRPKTETAEVITVSKADCRAPGRRDCRRVTVRLLSGVDEGTATSFTSGDAEAEVPLELGDRVRVYKNPLPPSAQIGGVRIDQYGFSDFDRRSPLAWLGVAFAALVLLTGRWQGLRALLGLVGSLAIILFFVVPAILGGGPAREVALIGALAIMLVTIPLAHGLGPKTIAACLGTSLSLFLTLTLAVTFTEIANLTGFSSEESVFLRASVGELSIRGLLLAGMVIGALGVLDDLTVTQSSTVMALRRADPYLSARRLFRSALVVGHDHIAATVNTLVLAYAGAALPVLLVFNLGGTAFGDAVNSEAVAEEIVAMLVGSIGLIAAVPITTAIAAILATHVDVRRLDEHTHAH